MPARLENSTLRENMANELPTRALRLAAVALSLLSISTTRASADESSYPDGVENSQDPKDVPTPPNEALAAIRLPDGFRATLFAAEPDVSQPVSLSFDDRGRLWVAECYTYKGSSGPWDSPVHDRILIFEDRDNDGRFDGRKVFTDKIQNLTSVLPGFGGVWATAAPRLVFIPDRDRDDVPDGPPKTLLDGWNDGGIGHCVVNGLNWGPDGWLYGNQGIQGVSNVGSPMPPKAIGDGSMVGSGATIRCGKFSRSSAKGRRIPGGSISMITARRSSRTASSGTYGTRFPVHTTSACTETTSPRTRTGSSGRPRTISIGAAGLGRSPETATRGMMRQVGARSCRRDDLSRR